MLASIRRLKTRPPWADRSPEASPHTRHIVYDDDDDEEEEEEEEEDNDDEADEDEDDDEDGAREAAPLLPIFSAAHLEALPVYTITHEIRRLIVSRCETTLSWDQLRSPQVSQFLIKPIQQQIHTQHFTRATLYALMANCLQFHKEAALHPGLSGSSRTRALVSELLAIKLLKEFTTRELIDALAYDFDPLQGNPSPGPTPGAGAGKGKGTGKGMTRGVSTIPSATATPWNQRSMGMARISCLEIAIRAQAKRFLAHPLVVQQLEAIWAGTIVFHSTADYLHRPVPKPVPPPLLARPPTLGYGSFRHPSQPHVHHPPPLPPSCSRRSVTLYDPRDASLFKLSRLRVPRYRQVLSTCSFAVLLGLYLAVIIRRPLEITPLELVFWFWSAGFMLDEIVGFNEQGFSLYILSFWNLFDLGILLLLVSHYGLRLAGIVLPDDRKQAVADQAYDVLAASAVLLFPRLFSVLDHDRYFSQLLIAFRIMAADLMAVCVLIVIATSGFFVAFTCSLGRWNAPSEIAYALFQMLMGFTPAAWTLWEESNFLGRGVLTLFLFLCHFVVVTILITVLTNSFMAIVQNANEEHQFVFAVNTFSMVKSDALFSYVAPTNILAWLITPLRYGLPFRQYVKLNRTIIKITHFPILLTICLYEKTILRASVWLPTDLTDDGRRSRARGLGPTTRRHGRRSSRFDAFTTSTRLVREPSIATYQKDRALEEVFRRPFRTLSRGVQESPDGRRKSNMVKDWMQGMESIADEREDGDDDDGNDDDNDRGGEEGPDGMEETPRRRRGPTRARAHRPIPAETTRSVASDPEEFIQHHHGFWETLSPRSPRDRTSRPLRIARRSETTDEHGDDERTSDDPDDPREATARAHPGKDGDPSHPAGDRADQTGHPNGPHDDPPSLRPSQRLLPANDSSVPAPMGGKTTPRFYRSRPSTVALRSRPGSPARRPKTPRHHSRNPSGATVLYNPVHSESESESPMPKPVPVPGRAVSGLSPSLPRSVPKRSQLGSGPATMPSTPGRRTPRRIPIEAGKRPAPRPRMPARSEPSSVPDFGLGGLDLGSDLGDNHAVGGGFTGVLPSSFVADLVFAPRPARPAAERDHRDLSKLVLARMSSLEEGFREVLREVKDLRQVPRLRARRAAEPRMVVRERRRRVGERLDDPTGPNLKKSKTNSEDDGFMEDPLGGQSIDQGDG